MSCTRHRKCVRFTPPVPPRRLLPLTGHHAPPCYRLFYGDFAAQPHTLTARDPAVQLTEALTVLRWHAGYVLSWAVNRMEVEFLLVGILRDITAVAFKNPSPQFTFG